MRAYAHAARRAVRVAAGGVICLLSVASPVIAHGDLLVEAVKNLGVTVATGEFGADMKVSLTNDGPVTFLVRSRENAVTPLPVATH